MPESIDIDALQTELAPLSHGEQALHLIQHTLRRLGSPTHRQDFLNAHLLCPPIRYDDVQKNLSSDPGSFVALQGDIVRTDAAYVLGERQQGASFLIATSTCDLVPERRETALFLPIEPRRSTDYETESSLRQDLSNLVSFKSKRYFYLPPLHDDDPDVLFNVAFLDPFAQCSNAALSLANRRRSMTLVGWRLFGAILRSIQVREGNEEVDVRVMGALG